MRELETLVTKDRLTGLPNREAILRRLARSVRRAERVDDYGFALLFIDLEGFGGISDTMGRRAGDTLLREVGSRIRSVVHPEDGVGRFAGEEFVVLLEDTDLDGARVAADRIVAALREPFRIEDRTITVDASVGVAMGTSTDSARELVIAADEAMYTAKATGTAVVAVAASSDEAPAAGGAPGHSAAP
jgi:diguanylate cyclase (GGDEF)-like protein